MTVPLHYLTRGTGAAGIAADLEEALRGGRLRPGDLLPTVRQAARELGVSPGTVAAAWQRLRARGVVVTGGRRGTRVSPRPPLSAPAREAVPAGVRNLADGNPDPALLPPLPPALRAQPAAPRLYSEARDLPALLAHARRTFAEEGLPAGPVAVLGGAMDGIERVLQAHLQAGDRVAVEDPGYPGVLDLVPALGLSAEPVAVDAQGLEPTALAAALARGARAVVLTPRAQNPTGAALDERRARDLRRVLAPHPEVLVIEDDHAGPVSGAPLHSLAHARRGPWALVRSVSKWLGPDLRVALLTGDPLTVARVQGRQALGAGWVSHVLQRAVLALWTAPEARPRLARAAAAYAERREALLAALAAQGLPATGRSGLNVWVPVPDEAAVVARLAAEGWGLREGSRYRLASGPAVRVTVARLLPRHAPRLAAALRGALAPEGRTGAA